MHYEVWDLKTGNLLAEYDTEQEALAEVSAALAAGWSPDDLGIGQDWDEGEVGADDDLAPTIHGADLAARAMAAGAGRQRRSA